MPPGDAASRKGTIDSMLLGCIPVHFYEAQMLQWPWHWGDWRRNASVLLDHRKVVSGEIDAVAALQAIPDAAIARMQDTIGAHAHVMQWSAIDTALLPSGLLPRGEGDAFDVALRGAWRASTSAHARTLVKQGHLRQHLAAQDRRAGHCGVTRGAGNCSSGDSGAWSLPQEERNGMGLTAACWARCAACHRCQYISYSIRWHDCSWYHSCAISGLHRSSLVPGKDDPDSNDFESMRVDPSGWHGVLQSLGLGGRE